MPFGDMFCIAINFLGELFLNFPIFSLPCSKPVHCYIRWSTKGEILNNLSRALFHTTVMLDFNVLCCCSSQISLSKCWNMAYCVRLDHTHKLIVFGVAEIKPGMEHHGKWDFRASRMSVNLHFCTSSKATVQLQETWNKVHMSFKFKSWELLSFIININCSSHRKLSKFLYIFGSNTVIKDIHRSIYFCKVD